MMRYIYFSYLISVVILISCSDDSNPTGNEPLTTEWTNFSVDQVDYDSLHIASYNSIVVTEKSVQKIILSELDDNVYLDIDSLVPLYESTGDEYYLNFSFSRSVNKDILQYLFRIKYFMSNEKTIHVDSSALMLTYPYKSAQVFISVDEMQTSSTTYQDFCINGDILYYHPTGPLGLYECDLTTKVVKELLGYPSGDYIAHDSEYLFWEEGRMRLFRYNLTSEETDLQFDLSQISYNRIAGLDCYKNELYILFHTESGSQLAKYSYDSNYISSINCGQQSYFLTVNDQYFISHDYSTKLFYFDVNTGNLIKEMMMPTSEPEGIRIYDQNLYFVDFYKRIIGYVPVPDLID